MAWRYSRPLRDSNLNWCRPCNIGRPCSESSWGDQALTRTQSRGGKGRGILAQPICDAWSTAAEVIDSEQFEIAKEQAGVHFERFRPYVIKDAAGFPGVVGIEINTHDGTISHRPFSSDDEIQRFIGGLKYRLDRGLQLFAWEEYEFELDGDAESYLKTLQDAFDTRSKPPIEVQRDKIFDLSNYYERITGIGEPEPFLSPYIVKRSDNEGWFPSNLLP